MSRLISAFTFATALVIAPAMSAQAPGRAPGPPPDNRAPNGPPMDAPMGPPMGPPSIDAASMLLAHTGEFKLTDGQVTRLAAIARRTADRRKTMMASMDSLRRAHDAARASGTDVREEPSPAMRAQFDRMREQGRADLRDAITILTPEQQAQGWEMMAMHAAGGQGMRGAPGMSGPAGDRGGNQGGPPPGRHGPGNRPPGEAPRN